MRISDWSSDVCSSDLFGWSGDIGARHDLHFETYGGVTSGTIDLSEQDIEEYYNGYANRTLWPLFHYRLDLTEFERTFQGGYERVNEAFARIIAPHIDADDLVWVHDRSEEHTSELQSLMRTSYAVFCLKKK